MSVDWRGWLGGLLVLLLPLLALGGEPVEVRVSGIDGELRTNVRAALSLRQRAQQRNLSPALIEELHQRAPREIARALEPFGYYRPEVHAELRPGTPWRARYRVDPGPPLPVSRVRVSFGGPGAEDPALQGLVDRLPLREGGVLDHRQYEAAKRQLLEQVQRRGYRGASLATHRVSVDLEAYRAEVRLRVATGRRFVIGSIDFDQARFSDEYLARYLVVKPGDPFDTRALARQRQALSRSGHFREVEIEALPPAPDEPGAVPLRVRLEPLPANRYRGRLAWGTDSGVGAQLDWVRRYVGSRGQHFNLGLALVEERRKLAGDLNYVIPLDPLSGSRLSLGARHESKDLTYRDVDLPEGGETRIATNLLQATWQRQPLRWGAFTVKPTLGLSLVEESYDVFEVLFGNLPGSSQDRLIELIGAAAYDTLTPDFEALVPNLQLALRRGDEGLFLRDGDFLGLALLGASEALASNIDFWQARLNSWHIRSLGDRGRLLLRSGLGYSEADSSTVLAVQFNAMPEYYEFRAGGVRSVRGYGFETLVPDDAITGGKHQLVASVEYEHEVAAGWSVAAFVDGGNSFNRWEDYDARIGAGLGLRWRSPVGLVRFDLGVPLDEADDAFQIYITVGPEF